MSPGTTDERAVRGWSIAVVLAAGLLFVLGGGWANLRGSAGEGSGEIVLPVALEPERGELPAPPTHFRWIPGTEGATSQLVLHKMTYEPMWSSPPLRGVSEYDVPLEAYDGIAAGEPIVWRVREARDGKPLGSSAYVTFTFRVDSRGYGPGEAPTEYEYMD